MLEAILDYIDNGLAVLPLHSPIKTRDGVVCSCGNKDCRSPAKHPIARLAPHGLHSATRDAHIAKAWFCDADRLINVGLVTGQTSGLVAIDIDTRHDGHKTLDNLEAKHGRLPETCRFKTGGGGEHILFRHPGCPIPNSAAKIGTGIDVRGEGGYIVAPPSLHISGRRYSVASDAVDELAAMPEWLLDAIMQARSTSKTQMLGKWQPPSGPIPVGQRNDQIARLSGLLLGRGIDPHTTVDLVLAYNQTHCAPPLQIDEALRTIASITRREAAKRGAL